MWGHYSKNHTGFCVGFNEQKIIKSGLFDKGGSVVYEKDFPNIDPRANRSIELSVTETHTKARDWKYEKEYRLLNLFGNPPETPDDRKVYLGKSLFVEINIGIHFPKKDIAEITAIAKTTGIPLYQVKQIPFKFKLTRQKLN